MASVHSGEEIICRKLQPRE